jgi:uncharacterized membrane protein YdbT with pleckstrin-like domain
MPFPRRLLTEDEEVVVELRPHWAFLGWPLVAAVGAVAVSIAVLVALSHAPAGVMYVLLALVSGTALWLAARLVRWFATTLVVTNSRIVQRSGVLSRSGFELRLERVNQLSYHQTILDRIFRTGELHVEMGGDTGVVLFDHVPRPAAVQSVITEQINALHQRHMGASDSTWEVDPGPGPTGDTPPAGTPRVARAPFEEGSVAGRLVELDELRRRGILTDAEFASKKAELLDRL